MSKFKKIAQDTTVLCKLQSGRTKIENGDIAGEELTIIAFDFAPKFDQKTNEPIIDPETGEVETYGVLVFKEYPENYYNSGMVMSKVCHAWMEGYETPEEASADLAAEGGVTVRITMGKTKKGNNIGNVEII